MDSVSKIKWVSRVPTTRENVFALMVIFAFGCFGRWMDKQETLRATSFRDKSKLYGRPRKEGEPPSWP